MKTAYVPIPVTAETRDRLNDEKRRRSAEAGSDWTYEILLNWFMDATRTISAAPAPKSGKSVLTPVRARRKKGAK
jgi:hypothetical protein